MRTRPVFGVLLLFVCLPLLSPCVAADPRQASVDRYGDPLPEGALARLGTRRFRHTRHALAIAFSPDGKTLVTASGDIRVWDAATGKCLSQFDSPSKDCPHSLDFTPDGKTLIVGSHFSDAIYLYDFATGRQTSCLGDPPFGREAVPVSEAAEVRRIALLPGGKAVAGRRLVSEPAPGGGERIWNEFCVWDLKTGKPQKCKPPNGIQHWYTFFACAPDGRILATDGAKEQVLLWDWTTGKVVRTLEGQRDSPLCAAFARDGRVFASAGMGGRVLLWEVVTGKLRRRLEGHRRPIRSLQFHPDGRTLISASMDRICRWDVTTGRLVREFRVRTDDIQAVALAPDGARLAAVSWGGTIQVWDTATGKERPAFEGHRAEVSAVVFGPDDRTFVSAGPGELLVWDVATKKALRRFGGRELDAERLAFLPGGKALLIGGSRQAPQVWDPSTGRMLREFRGPRHSHRLQLSDDGKHAVSVEDSPKDGEAEILLWDVAAGKFLGRFGPRYKKGDFRHTCFAVFSHDGKRLMSGGINREIRAWGVPDGKPLGVVSDDSVDAAGLSPDGRLLATMSFTQVRFYDLPSGKRAGTFGKSANGGVSWDCPLVFSPDGRALAVGGEDGDVRLCEVATRKERRRLAGHEGFVRRVSFSADGRRLLTAGEDATILLWDLTAPGRSVKDSPAAWAALAGEDGARAYDALCRLVTAPGRAVPFLRARLSPALRATEERLRQLLADLDSSRFAQRDRAERELEELGEVAEPALAQALKGSPALEFRRRAERLLARADADRRTPSGERLRQLRAVEALERMGTPGARRLLRHLAAGAPEARLTREARASLERLSKWPAAISDP
jgi:WD40 repeat protein